MAFEDKELADDERMGIVVENLFYAESMPAIDDAAEFWKQVTWYLGGCNDAEPDDEGAGVRLYSFNKDAQLIYAAFQQTHGIDLQKEDMHWLRFLLLFMDLGQETSFCQLVSLRKRVATGKASKEERAAAREMGAMFELEQEDTRTEEERIAEANFEAIVARAKK